METTFLYASDGQEVVHRAQVLASVSSYSPEASPTRWSVLTLYENSEGKLLCQETGRTKVPGEITRYQLTQAGSEQDLIAAVGHGWLAKRLYDAAGIEHSTWLGPDKAAGSSPVQHLTRDGAPDVAFRGHLLCSVTTDRPHPHERNRWAELHLYQIENGQLVCHEKGCSRLEGELTRHQAYHANDPAALADKIGSGRLARDLYKLAGWSCLRRNYQQGSREGWVAA